MIGVSEVLMLAIVFLLGLVLILILVWVYRDAVTRYPYGSVKPLLWLLVVFFTHILGLILYILLRPEVIEKGSEKA
jgi:beta-lactamase regulating signal transducer with metallopeptidase domain